MSTIDLSFASKVYLAIFDDSYEEILSVHQTRQGAEDATLKKRNSMVAPGTGNDEAEWVWDDSDECWRFYTKSYNITVESGVFSHFRGPMQQLTLVREQIVHNP